jgi:hypothetical protein
MPSHNGRKDDGFDCEPTQDDEKAADSIPSSMGHPGAPKKERQGASKKKLGTRKWSGEVRS